MQVCQVAGDLFPLQLARQEQHFREQPRSAASGTAPLQAWGEMAGVQEE